MYIVYRQNVRFYVYLLTWLHYPDSMPFGTVAMTLNISLVLLRILLYHHQESPPCEIHITGEKFNVRFHIENALFLYIVAIMHNCLIIGLLWKGECVYLKAI